MRYGFSLVELSIVLVILGLLTGGILAGQSLIRASEVRAVTTEYARYITASQTFRDKYFAIPGDIATAVSFWNRQVNQAWCLPTSGATVTTPGTCNGSGNGAFGQAGGASQSGERFQFWRHMALAGLIEGDYSGLAGSGANDEHDPGVNSPASRMSPATWYVFSNRTAAGSAGAYFASNTYGNELNFANLGSSGTTNAAILRPEEAWNIDTKLDDGKPGRGRLMGNLISTCTDAGAAAGSQNLLDSNYLLTSSTVGCSLIFPGSF